MNKPYRLRHTLGFAYVATALAQLAEVAFVFLLYRQFEKAEVGLFSWAGAWFAFFYVVTDFGLEALMVRRTASQPTSLQRMVQAVLVLRMPLFFLGVSIITIFWILHIIDGRQVAFLLLLSGQIIFNIIDNSQRAWLRANGRQTTASALLSGLSILKLLVMVIFGVWLENDLAMVLFALLSMRLPYSILHRKIGAACPAQVDVQDDKILALVRWQLRVGFPLLFMGLLTALQNRLDWLLVARFVSLDALAIYSLANKAYEIAQIVIGVAMTTMYPILCKQNSPGASPQMTILKVVVLTGIFIGIGGMISLPSIISLVFDGKYKGIDLPIKIMMSAVGFMAAAGVLYNLALSRHLEKKILIVAGIATILQAVGNFWLVINFGVAGASVGMLILVVLTAYGLLYVCARSGIVYLADAWRISATLFANALVCGMIILVQEINFLSGFVVVIFVIAVAPALIISPVEWRIFIRAYAAK